MSGQGKDKSVSRRGLLKGSAIFLAGGAAGYLGAASLGATAARSAASPPPLPWPWVKLDPLEAGRRTYQSYLTKKG